MPSSSASSPRRRRISPGKAALAELEIEPPSTSFDLIGAKAFVQRWFAGLSYLKCLSALVTKIRFRLMHPPRRTPIRIPGRRSRRPHACGIVHIVPSVMRVGADVYGPAGTGFTHMARCASQVERPLLVRRGHHTNAAMNARSGARVRVCVPPEDGERINAHDSCAIPDIGSGHALPTGAAPGGSNARSPC